MKLHIIESNSKEEFLKDVNSFFASVEGKLFSIKCQRNLYYSLSGSTHRPEEIHKETSHLKEGYVAFITYEELS